MLWALATVVGLANPPDLSGVGSGTAWPEVPPSASSAQSVGQLGVGVCVGAAPLVLFGQGAMLRGPPAHEGLPGGAQVDMGRTAFTIGIGALALGAPLALGGGLGSARRLRGHGERVRPGRVTLGVAGLVATGVGLAAATQADDPRIGATVAGLGSVLTLAIGADQLARNDHALSRAHLPPE